MQDGKIKGFTTKARYIQHQRIHMGIKPFKCKICEYSSTRSDNVLFHARKVHKIEKPTKRDDVHVDEIQLLNEEFDTQNSTTESLPIILPAISVTN